MRIGLDVDGVVYRYVACMTNWLVSEYGHLLGYDFSAPVAQWHFYRDWTFNGKAMTGNDLHREMDRAAEAGHLFRSEMVDPEWITTIKQWRADGHSVHLITARTGAHHVANTAIWLEAQGIPFDSLSFTEGGQKSLVNVDVLVDDRDKNVAAWIEQTGKPGIIFDQPWNQDYDAPTHLQVRAHGIEDLAAIIGLLASPAVEPFTDGETILQEADRIVATDRQADYGHPIVDFTRTGRMWGAIIGIDDIAPEKVGLCMAALKISREVNKPKRDNRVDAAGYMKTVDLVVQKQEQNQ